MFGALPMTFMASAIMGTGSRPESATRPAKTEMMLHGVSLNLVAFSNFHQNMQGQSFTAFILTVAACEAGLALALILTLYKRSKSLDVNLWSQLAEADIESPHEEEPAVPTAQPVQEFPHLTPAGRSPVFENGRRV